MVHVEEGGRGQYYASYRTLTHMRCLHPWAREVVSITLTQHKEAYFWVVLW